MTSTGAWACDDAGMSASAWRRLESEIQSSLATFEKAREWADLSICLQRLHKTIARTPNSPTTGIPCLVPLSKKLSQCLNPTLPSGIHTRALMVYEALMHRLGPERLVICFPLLMTGLHSFYPAAATTVRNVYFDIFESLIKPVLRQFVTYKFDMVSCLVVSGEDEKCPEFQRFCQFINNCEEAWSIEAVAHTLWSIAAKLVTHRLGALRTLSRRIEAAHQYYSHREICERVFANVATLEAAECCLMPCEESPECPGPTGGLTRETSSSAPAPKGQPSAMSLSLAQRLVLDFLITYLPVTSDLIATPKKIKIMSALIPLILSKDVGVRTRVNQWLISLDASLGKGGGEESTQSSYIAEDFPVFKACASMVASQSILIEIDACAAEALTEGNPFPQTTLQHWARARGISSESLLLQSLRYLLIEAPMAVSIRQSVMPNVALRLCEYLAERKGYGDARRSESVPIESILVSTTKNDGRAKAIAYHESTFSGSESSFSCLWLRKPSLVGEEKMDVDCDLAALELFTLNREDSVLQFFQLLRQQIALQAARGGAPLGDGNKHLGGAALHLLDSVKLLVCARYFFDYLSDPLMNISSLKERGDGTTSDESSSDSDSSSGRIGVGESHSNALETVMEKASENLTPDSAPIGSNGDGMSQTKDEQIPEDPLLGNCRLLTTIQSRHLLSLMSNTFGLLCQTLNLVQNPDSATVPGSKQSADPLTVWLSFGIHLGDCLSLLESQIRLAPHDFKDFAIGINKSAEKVITEYSDNRLNQAFVALCVWKKLVLWITSDAEFVDTTLRGWMKTIDESRNLFLMLMLDYLAENFEDSRERAQVVVNYLVGQCAENSGLTESTGKELRFSQYRLLGEWMRQSLFFRGSIKQTMSEGLQSTESIEQLLSSLETIYSIADLERQLKLQTHVECLMGITSELALLILEALTGYASNTSSKHSAGALIDCRQHQLQLLLSSSLSTANVENFLGSIIPLLVSVDYEIVYAGIGTTLEAATYKTVFAFENLIQLLKVVEVACSVSQAPSRELLLLSPSALALVESRELSECPPLFADENSTEGSTRILSSLQALRTMQPVTLFDLIRLQLFKFAAARPSAVSDSQSLDLFLESRCAALKLFMEISTNINLPSLQKSREIYAIFGHSLLALHTQACRDGYLSLASLALETFQRLRICGDGNNYELPLVSDITMWNLAKAGHRNESSPRIGSATSKLLCSRMQSSISRTISQRREFLPLRDGIIFAGVRVSFEILTVFASARPAPGDKLIYTSRGVRDCFNQLLRFLISFSQGKCSANVMVPRLESCMQLLTSVMTTRATEEMKEDALLAIINLTKHCLTLSSLDSSTVPPSFTREVESFPSETLRRILSMHDGDKTDRLGQEINTLVSESFLPIFKTETNSSNLHKWKTKLVMTNLPQLLVYLEGNENMAMLRKQLMSMMWDAILPTFIQVVHHAWATLSLESRPEGEMFRASFVDTLINLPNFDLSQLWKETIQLIGRSEDKKTSDGDNIVFKLRAAPMYELLFLTTKACSHFDKTVLRQRLVELMETVSGSSEQPIRLIWILDIIALLSHVAPLNRDVPSFVNPFKAAFLNILGQVFTLLTTTSIQKSINLDLIPPLPMSINLYESFVLSAVHSSTIQGKNPQQKVVRPSLSPIVKHPDDAHSTDLNDTSVDGGTSSITSPTGHETPELQLRTELLISSSVSDLLNQYAIEGLLNFILSMKSSFDGIAVTCLRMLITYSPLTNHLLSVFTSQSGLQTCTTLHYLTLNVLNELVYVSLRIVTDSSLYNQSPSFHPKPLLSNLLIFGSTGMLESLSSACQSLIIKSSKSVREWFLSASLESIFNHDRRTTRVMLKILHSSILGTLLKANNFMSSQAICGDQNSEYPLLEGISSLDDVVPQPSLGIFTTWSSEVTLRSTYLSRIAFIFFNKQAKNLMNDLESVLARLADYSRIANKEQSGDLKVKVLMALKVLLFRSAHANSPQLWNFLIYECSQILLQVSRPCVLHGPEIGSKLSATNPIDLNLMLATLRLLDLMSFSKPKFPHHHLFFPIPHMASPRMLSVATECQGDPGSMFGETATAPSLKDIPDTGASAAESKRSPRSATVASTPRTTSKAVPANFVPLLELLYIRVESIQKAKGCPSVSAGLVAKLDFRVSMLRSEATRSNEERRLSHSSFGTTNNTEYSARSSQRTSLSRPGTGSIPETMGPAVVVHELRNLQQLLKLIEALCVSHLERQTFLTSTRDWAAIESSIEAEFMSLPNPLIDWADAIELASIF
eukprot:Gregarina_sp_Poly_1__5888@NODE_30_length_19457_cov_61_697267_g27_i0_p1_GENE_NODE_30_length_19457_cov_61_697267_g27_i0NODE_30_length_19457_cov_61_697267_g27_i0_p1_ORF_typecomplete_len2274_score292_83Dopey_N/PF04118_14/7_4e52Dopey_N/PF04118_14/4_2e03_NODE_30_length_19457_cov_61_697267_g27_i0706313884